MCITKVKKCMGTINTKFKTIFGGEMGQEGKVTGGETLGASIICIS